MLMIPTSNAYQNVDDSLPFGLVPGGETVTMLAKKMAALGCVVAVKVTHHVFGYWKPDQAVVNSNLKAN